MILSTFKNWAIEITFPKISFLIYLNNKAFNNINKMYVIGKSNDNFNKIFSYDQVN